MTQGQHWAMTSFAGRCSVAARGGSTAFEETEMGRNGGVHPDNVWSLVPIQRHCLGWGGGGSSQGEPAPLDSGRSPASWMDSAKGRSLSENQQIIFFSKTYIDFLPFMI